MKYKLFIPLTLAWVLAGCAGNPGTSSIGDITLNVGDSSVCLDTPCTVYMLMPPGEGTFVVREDGPGGVWKTGEYEAGKKVELGGYWAGRTLFTIDGGQFPETWLTVTGRP